MSRSRRKTEDPKSLRTNQLVSETEADKLAHTVLRPTVQAALTVRDYNKSFGEISINILVSDLFDQCEAASKGELGRAEALLMAQAQTLDAIFNSLARKAIQCEYLNHFEGYLRLGLKAQSQSRATLETLAALKNPRPIAFVGQANIAHGPQQVNNSKAHANNKSRDPQNSEKSPNKLLEIQNDERLDTGTPGAAGFQNSMLETLAAVHRPKNGGR